MATKVTEVKVNNFMGAKSLSDGTLLLDFFRELHVQANRWSQFQGVPSRQGKVHDLDQQDTYTFVNHFPVFF